MKSQKNMAARGRDQFPYIFFAENFFKRSSSLKPVANDIDIWQE